jgi:hypothetical protein
MAAARTNLKIADVLTALSINGEPGIAAKKFVELVQKVEALDSNQFLIRARDLTKEHVGLQIAFGRHYTGTLTDVEEQQKRRGMTFGGAYGLSVDLDTEVSEDEDGIQVTARGPVLIVLDGKLVRMQRNTLITVTK